MPRPQSSESKNIPRLATRAPKPHLQHRREHTQRGVDRPANNTANHVKTRLRSVRRLLENRNELMAPDQRIALEREQATLQYNLQESLEQARKRKLVSKYHMVRFFERRKAERALKRACKSAKETDNSTDVHDSSPTEVHQREVDLNYTIYFPLSEVYVSLYPKDKSSASAPNRSSPVWREVESAMTAGTLQDLRDRQSTAKSTMRTFRPQGAERDRHCHKRQFSAGTMESKSGPPLGIQRTPKTSKKDTQEINGRHVDAEVSDDGVGFFE